MSEPFVSAGERGAPPRSGPMDLHAVATLFRFELRTILRDRRTVLVSVVLPIVVTPLFFVLSFWAEGQREKRLEEKTLETAIVGPEAERLTALLAEAEEQFADDPVAEGVAPIPEGSGDLAGRSEQGGAEPARPDRQGTVEPLRRLEIVSPEKPLLALSSREIHLVVEAQAAEDDPGILDLTVHFRADRDDSTAAAREVESRLEEVRRARRAAALAGSGFPVDLADLAQVEETNVASAEEEAGALLGKSAALFVMLFFLTGGSIVAADTLAGERERGTLETLLTSAATRTEVVGAKLLLILAVALVIAVIQVVNLGVYVGLDLLPMASALDVDLSPSTLVGVFLLLVPLATVTAGILLTLSGRASSYKEFQLLFFPVFLVSALPCAAPILPGIELRSAVVLVPLANVAVALRDVLAGRVDLPFTVLAWVISMGAAVGMLRVAFGALSTERLILAGGADEADVSSGGGPARFSRRVLVWFAGMWAVIFLASAGSTTLASDLRLQAVFNILVVMVGTSLLIVRVHRLDPVETFRLRLPHPAVWLAVVLGAPASILAGLGVMRVSNRLFPLPEKLLRGLEEAFTLDLPLAQVLLLLAVLPGVGEELAFRGVLLSGLRRRMGPTGAVVVSSLVFAFFHFQVVRFLPVAWLALLVGALTLVTRSIYPAMLWHALYNGLLVSAQPAGFDPELLPAWMLALGAAVTALAFWLAVRVSAARPPEVVSSAGT